ncbi:MAG TPA: hypothetical protein DDX72_07120 [Ruminococcaceae bacterium]|nr:hypothetical protein [Oscillospiraceae bacterium]
MNGYKADILSSDLNPTVFTARASLMGGAANGDRNAEKLIRLIDKEEQISERITNFDIKEKEKLYRFSSVCGTAAWVRSRITEKIFDTVKMTVFADLGCGLNQRGLSFADRKYIRYYGIDLPPVINRMKRIVLPEVSSDSNIMYIPADVTDLNALRSVFTGREPLFIATEGLMMYLTETEVQTVISNISALLSEHGGVWLTGDTEERSVYEYIIRSLFGNDESVINGILGSELSEKWRSLLYDNSFVTLKGQDFTELLGKYGLKSRKVRVSSLIRDLDIPDHIRKAYETTHFLEITSVASRSNRPESSGTNAFSITPESDGGTLIFHINGRLDSINSPKLIGEYTKIFPEKQDKPVILDLADCLYITSAGIRAVLMIYNRAAGIKNGLSLRNINPDVLEILKTTGFTKFI